MREKQNSPNHLRIVLFIMDSIPIHLLIYDNKLSSRIVTAYNTQYSFILSHLWISRYSHWYLFNHLIRFNLTNGLTKTINRFTETSFFILYDEWNQMEEQFDLSFKRSQIKVILIIINWTDSGFWILDSEFWIQFNNEFKKRIDLLIDSMISIEYRIDYRID